MKIFSGTVVTLAVASAAVFATRSSGEPVHDVELSDSGVWVSSGATGMWGRFNRGAYALDTVIGGGGTGPRDVEPGSDIVRPDVLQDGRTVVGMTTDRELVPIDPTTGEPSDKRGQVPTPRYTTGADVFRPTIVDLRGGTIAMTEPGTGQVWAKRITSSVPDLSDFTEQREPIATLGKDTALAVDIEGNVKAVSAQTGKVIDIPAEGDGFGDPEEHTLKLGGGLADITAVGETWVVLDLTNGDIWSEGEDKPSQVNGGDADSGGLMKVALQQPGPDRGAVAYSTVEEVGFAGIGGSSGQDQGKIVFGERSANLPPVFVKVSRPVVNGKCTFGVRGMGSDISYQVLCSSDTIAATTIREVGNLKRFSGVALRSNRGQVLLNDVDTGRVYDLGLGTRDPRVDTWPTAAELKSATQSPSTPTPQS